MRFAVAGAALVGLVSTAHAVDEADRSGVRAAIEAQLDAFQRDDAAAAFSYAAPSIQGLFADQERFMAMVREGYRPVYRSKGHTFGDLRDTPLGLTQSVEIKDVDGVDWIALYTFVRQPDGSLKINGC